VASKLVELIKAAMYAGIQNNFNQQMDAALSWKIERVLQTGLKRRGKSRSLASSGPAARG